MTRPRPAVALLVAALLALAGMPTTAAGEGGDDARQFCGRFRNGAVFEMWLADSRAEQTAGRTQCEWTFQSAMNDDLRVTVRLESRETASPTAARQMILIARLPGNNRGREVAALPGIGDDAMSRAVVEGGVTKVFEIEAAKGRRHVHATVRWSSGELDYIRVRASVWFIGAL